MKDIGLKIELACASMILIAMAIAIYQGVNAEPNPTQSSLHVTTQTRGQLQTVNPQQSISGTQLQNASRRGL